MKTMSQKFKEFLKYYRVIETAEYIIENEMINPEDLPDDEDDLTSVFTMMSYKTIHTEVDGSAEVLYDVIDKMGNIIYHQLTYNEIDHIIDNFDDTPKEGEDND